MKDRNCIKCGKLFKVKNYLVERGHGKYCSQECYHKDSIGKITIWNKGLTGYSTRQKSGKIIKCVQCGSKKYFEQNQLKKRPCKYCSVKCAREAEKKTTLTVYSSIHNRIKKDFGKADICEKCGNGGKVDWANISGKYLLKREDWKKLCRKCHIAYDKKKNNLAFKNFTR